MSNRLLTFAMTFLVIIIIGEILYLFVIKPNSKSEVTVTQTKSVSQSETNTQSVTNEPEYLNSAISQERIDSLNNIQVFKEGVLKEATLKYVLEGTIINKVEDSRTLENGEIVPVVSLELKGSEGLTNTFTYSTEPSDKISLVEVDSSGNKSITFDDIAIGDTLTIIYTLDLLEDLDFRDTIKSTQIIKQ